MSAPDAPVLDAPSTFADLGVPADVAAGLERRGIATPFPVQAATIPDALEGRDVCGKAPTGSGKTIAFGIPLVLGVDRARPKRPQGLVLVPTRELASQVHEELVTLGRPLGRSVLAVYGGVGFERQITALRRGVDIVVACPGRLADLISQGQVDLRDVQVAVVDEADRMADMGFLPEVRRLLDRCPADRQTLLFSATLDGDVDVLIRRYQHEPVRHETGTEDGDRINTRAAHHFWKVPRPERVQTAAAVVDRLGPTVVFCRTKRGADRVARQLAAAGVPSAAIHGDRSQNQRESALRSFHEGRVRALVATDVAARGIHVDGVAGVVHFDPPADHKDYVHRSGRTARAGQRGTVVSLVPPELRKPVASLQKELDLPVGLTPVDLEELPEVTRVAVRERIDRREAQPAAPRREGPRRARKRPHPAGPKPKGKARPGSKPKGGGPKPKAKTGPKPKTGGPKPKPKAGAKHAAKRRARPAGSGGRTRARAR